MYYLKLPFSAPTSSFSLSTITRPFKPLLRLPFDWLLLDSIFLLTVLAWPFLDIMVFLPIAFSAKYTAALLGPGAQLELCT